jgi:hypothetical protein
MNFINRSLLKQISRLDKHLRLLAADYKNQNSYPILHQIKNISLTHATWPDTKIHTECRSTNKDDLNSYAINLTSHKVIKVEFQSLLF